MARDRGASLLNLQEEASSVFGLKVPDVVKKMVPFLSKVDKILLRKLIQGKRQLFSLPVPTPITKLIC